jgi:sarcosine oxidase, subunit beta
VAPCLDQVLGTASANVAARQQADGRLRVSSGILPWDGVLTHDDQGHPRASPDAATLSGMLMRVAEVLPAFATTPVERFWGGVIDLTPDALPVLGPVPGIAGLHVASGFSGHGFCLGPVTGRIMRDLLLGREQERDLAAFAFERFGEGAQPAAPLTLHG